MKTSQTKLGIQWYLLISSYVYGSYWNAFMTHPLYVDVRMLIEEKNYYNQRNIPKAFSELDARLRCIQYCALDPKCLALHFCSYEGNFYVCELLLDNMCQRENVTIFEASPGCTVWEKQSTGMNESCVQKKYGKIIEKPCDMFKPGCWGTWPNCTCSKTCADWYRNLWTTYKSMSDGQQDNFATFLWPDGNWTSVPVPAWCWNSINILIWRQIEMSTGRILHDYRMDFSDANRIYKVMTNINFQLRFYVNKRWQYIYFSNSFLHANGSLTNLSYVNSWPQSFDILNIKNTSSKIIPFVTVQNDIYGCGSFWLLDSKNATYCPGGTAGMLGTIRMNGSTIVRTGIRYPDFTVPINESLVIFY